jgi:hypothetical protein
VNWLPAYKNMLLLTEELLLELQGKCNDPLHQHQLEEIHRLQEDVRVLEEMNDRLEEPAG